MQKNQEITFNANGVKLDGKHIHGDYIMNGKNGYMNNSVPKKSIIIKLNTVQKIVVPGLISQNETDSLTDYFDRTKLVISPKNRNYKKALSAYKKARAKEIKREIEYCKKDFNNPKLVKIRESNIRRLERELKTLN